MAHNGAMILTGCLCRTVLSTITPCYRFLCRKVGQLPCLKFVRFPSVLKWYLKMCPDIFLPRPHKITYHNHPLSSKRRDSSVGIELSYWLIDRGSRLWFPAEAGDFSFHHRVQSDSAAHPASYPIGTRGSFPGGKAGGAWTWPLTST
jgi:hypothetical protein